MRSRVCLVVLIVVVGALLAGCGGSSGSSSSTAGSATPTTTAAGGSAASSALPGSSGGSRTSSRTTSASGSPTSAKPAQLSSGTVATVAGTPITTAAYTHWLSVSAPATVKPLIANASDYSGCIAAIKSREARTEKLIKKEEENFAKKSKGRAKESGLLSRERKPKTEAQGRQQCKLLYKAFKQQAASTLIRRLQTQVQAKELGIDVSEAEVAKAVRAREASQKALAKNPRSREFLAEVARYTGADLKEMVTSQLLESQIYKKAREKFTKTGSISQEQGTLKYNEEARAKLKAQTECAAGYVVALCKEYAAPAPIR